MPWWGSSSSALHPRRISGWMRGLNCQSAGISRARDAALAPLDGVSLWRPRLNDLLFSESSIIGDGNRCFEERIANRNALQIQAFPFSHRGNQASVTSSLNRWKTPCSTKLRQKSLAKPARDHPRSDGTNYKVRQENMKRSKLKPFIVAVMILAVVGVPLLLHQWKLGSDRAGCRLNMLNMHQTIHSVGGMRGVGAGQPYPGGPRELLKGLGQYATLPRCPSGGTYIFWSDNSYSVSLSENIRCSHASDLNHSWPNDQQKDKQTKAEQVVGGNGG